MLLPSFVSELKQHFGAYGRLTPCLHLSSLASFLHTALLYKKWCHIHISVYAPFCKKVGIFAHVNGLLPQHRISLYHRISYTMFPLQNWSWWTIVEHDILMITRNLGNCANVIALKKNATKIEIWMNFILHFCVSGHDVKQ